MLAKFAGAPQTHILGDFCHHQCYQGQSQFLETLILPHGKLLPRSRQPGIQLGQKGCLSMIEALLQGELPPPRCSTEASDSLSDKARRCGEETQSRRLWQAGTRNRTSLPLLVFLLASILLYTVD
ncbi:hypothetical protein WJX79_010508 [Trebouxia sp. C0005]